jgi:conjugative transfer region protein (TIGR03748 family)
MSMTSLPRLPNTTALFFMAGMAISGAAFSATDADTVRVSRYTQVVGPDAVARDPLAVVATLRFPREVVATVGDALRYLLQRTGYSLNAADTDAEHLFALALPEAQRQLGPNPVRTLARLLAGNGFGVCSNARTRVVSVVAMDDAANVPCRSK